MQQTIAFFSIAVASAGRFYATNYVLTVQVRFYVFCVNAHNTHIQVAEACIKLSTESPDLRIKQ